MSSKPDDLEAVRSVADTLQPFANDDRERIIRWAREKLGMSSSASVATAGRVEAGTDAPRDAAGAGAGTPSAVDIKKFVNEKAPKSDVHFAATVAYYYQFKASDNQRKEAITKEDLVEACRQVDRKRPKRSAQVLVNAYHDGLFDRGGKGSYKLNSVGENLVAMALPGANETGKTPTRRSKKPRRTRQLRKKGARKGR
jgi:hypothetical protein